MKKSEKEKFLEDLISKPNSFHDDFDNVLHEIGFCLNNKILTELAKNA